MKGGQNQWLLGLNLKEASYIPFLGKEQSTCSLEGWELMGRESGPTIVGLEPQGGFLRTFP